MPLGRPQRFHKVLLDNTREAFSVEIVTCKQSFAQAHTHVCASKKFAARVVIGLVYISNTKTVDAKNALPCLYLKH